jgi:hypothetical protein
VVQHDEYMHAAIGLMVGAGLVGAAATASIWVRMPGTPVQVTLGAPGSVAGITLQGAWKD